MKRFATPHSTQRNTGGFTLVEMLISLGLFSIVMTIATGALLTLVDANRKAQSLHLVMSNLNFALDSVSRTVSTGSAYYCDDLSTNNDTLPGGTNDCDGENGLVVTNDKGQRIGFLFEEGRLFRNVGEAGWAPITGGEVVLEALEFRVQGSEFANGTQPFVTLATKGSVEGLDRTETDFDIQTAITKRIIDE